MKYSFSTWRIFWIMYLSLLCLEFVNIFISMDSLKVFIIGVNLVLIAMACSNFFKYKALRKTKGDKP